MKKILSSILFIFVLLFGIDYVYADGFTVSLNGNNTFTSDVTLKLQITNYQDHNSLCGGVCGVRFRYTYDNSKIELVSIQSIPEFRLTQGNKIVLSGTNGVGSGTNIVTFVFRNRSLNDGESTTISITDVDGSNGDGDLTSNNTSKTIRYVAPAPQTTTTTKPATTTTTKPSSSSSAVTTTKSITTTTKTTTKSDDKKSNITDLKELTISSGNLVFSKDVLNYNVVVANDVNEVTIVAKAAHDKAKVNGTGKYELKDGENKIEVKVTAEDGSTKTYIIIVTKDTQVPTDEPIEIVTPPTNNEIINTTTTGEKDGNMIPKSYIIPLLVCITVLLGIIVCLLFKLNKLKNYQI